VKTDSRELDGETSSKVNASLYSFHKLRDLRVAWVETRVGVDDAHYRSGESVFAVAGGLDEYFAQKEREVSVAVRGQAPS
jgi:hypothetical protein